MTTRTRFAVTVSVMATILFSTAAQEPDEAGVVLLLPPQYAKYASKMPTHVPVIRADHEGKQTAARTITGRNLPDGRAAGKSRFVFQILGTQVVPAKNNFGGGAIVLTTTYKLFYRGPKKYEEITKGEFTTSGFASPFKDSLAEHFGQLGTGLSTDVSRALASKVLDEKEIKVPSPLRNQNQGFETPENPRERVAYKVERRNDAKTVFFTFQIHNRLPVQVKIREMEIVNTVTGECHNCTPDVKGEAWLFDAGKRVAVGARMPANQAPLEAQAVRIRELYLVIPDE